jgi:undecaprenyl-diphosphatase
MDYLIAADRSLFRLLNGEWHNSLFDAWMPVIRNSATWVPFYLFLILLVSINAPKNRLAWVLFAAGTAILSNFISSDLIKENVYRLRPCNDPAMADQLRFLLKYRPQSSSFTSSHAVNHFALAAFLTVTMRKYFGNCTYLFFLWALIIIYAQVYVGVHYPLDVIAGALIGSLLGALSGTAFNKQYGLTKHYG